MKKILYVGARAFVLNKILELGMQVKPLILKDTFASRELSAKEIPFIGFSKKEELLKEIENSDFNILISCGCPFILPVSQIKKPGQIFVNIHPSLLPNLKGKSPINGAILFDLPIGVTCHEMDDNIDSGKIISQIKIKTSKNMSLGLIYRIVFETEIKAFMMALRRNFKADENFEHQNVSVDYYTKKENDALIDFTLSNSQILKTIAAFSTLTQQSFFIHKNHKYRVYNANIIKNKHINLLFKDCKNLSIVSKYDNSILIKKDNEFIELTSTQEEFKGLEEGLELDTLNFSNDLYFKKSYASLYLNKHEEIFEFVFQERDNFFHNLAIKSPIKNSGYFDLQSVYGYGGIYTNSKDINFITKAFSKMKEECNKQNIIAQFVRFHPFNQNIEVISKNLNFIGKNRSVVYVDTSLEPSERRSLYSSRMKSIVSKAKKILKIEECLDKDEFKNIYYESMIKNKASDFYFFDSNYFTNLFKIDGFAAYKAIFNNEVCSVASFILGKNFAYYHLSGTKTEILSKNLNANAALLDFFFDIAYEKNIKYCILGGGISDNDSLLEYKQKFSKKTIDFYIGGIIYNQEIYDKLNFLANTLNSKKFLRYRE